MRDLLQNPFGGVICKQAHVGHAVVLRSAVVPDSATVLIEGFENVDPVRDIYLYICIYLFIFPLLFLVKDLPPSQNLQKDPLGIPMPIGP